MDRQDSPDRQAPKFPPKSPTQHPRAQLVLLGSHLKLRERLLKAEATEAALPQPQSQHCCPVKSVPPSHFRLGVASRGIGKGGKLGWCAGRLWGSHEQVRSQDRYTLTILPGPLTPGPEALPPPPLPRLALGVLPQLLLMTCNWRSALSARSRSSSMNCCSRSLALASRAAVSFRNWSICTTSLGREQSLTPGPWPDCPQTSHRREVASGEDS